MDKSSDKSDSLKKAMIAALRSSLGVVETACKAAGIARSTHYLWLKQDADYAGQVAEVNEVSLDFAESQLFKVIRGYTMPDVKVFLDKDTKEPIIVPITKQVGTDVGATIFYLKTKGKARGYVERQQVENIPAGAPGDLLTDEQLEDEIARLLTQ